MDRQRIDKWLWHARIVRTRSAAAALTQAGFVRLNGVRVAAPGHMIRVGDVVTLALDRAVRVVKVEGFCERRGEANAARTLYRDLTTSSEARTSQIKACIFTGLPLRCRPEMAANPGPQRAWLAA